MVNYNLMIQYLAKGMKGMIHPLKYQSRLSKHDDKKLTTEIIIT